MSNKEEFQRFLTIIALLLIPTVIGYFTDDHLEQIATRLGCIIILVVQLIGFGVADVHEETKKMRSEIKSLQSSIDSIHWQLNKSTESKQS